MRLIDAALSHSRTVISLLLLILVSGAYAWMEIPKEADPDITIPKIYVTINHEGISQEDAERALVRPLEEKLRSIEGVKEMISWAREGGANILLEFDAGFDPDSALLDVREEVDSAKKDLPASGEDPHVQEINISLFPVLVVTMSGPLPERTLLRLARDVKDRIEAIPAVLEVKIAGDRDERVEVIVDPVLVESYALDPERMAVVVSRFNQLIAAGAMDTGQGRFSVKVPGIFDSVRDIMNLPVKVEGNAVVTLGDIATVQRTFRDADGFARVNGHPALALEVSKRAGENIIDTIAEVRDVVEASRLIWPEAVEVTYSQDKSKDIRLMLGDLQNNVISAVLLVMIVVIAALGWRSGVLVGIAIPGSFLSGILVLAAFGLTMNIVVLFALILAVGMLVDGAIVVTEYADRKMTEGEPRKLAYAMAAKRMSWPIIASTATTLAAFLPLLFWPGIVGQFMKYLPITLIATLAASLVMALVFVPTIGAFIGKPGAEDEHTAQALAAGSGEEL
ncbi:MAG: efflux RND transporter permease subunit, partial [Alphaproteobacteria bacterium]|nr:efflux RND transporter permease subunit [Alphaproteobacteria bacterium]